MTTPIRVQRKRTKGWRMPPNTVYVGRGSSFGNPFIIGKYAKDAEEAVALYRKWLSNEVTQEMTAWRNSLYDMSEDRFPAWNGFLVMCTPFIKETLEGKNLACWCPLDKPCHADVLLEIANSGDKET